MVKHHYHSKEFFELRLGGRQWQAFQEQLVLFETSVELQHQTKTAVVLIQQKVPLNSWVGTNLIHGENVRFHGSFF